MTSWGGHATKGPDLSKYIYRARTRGTKGKQHANWWKNKTEAQKKWIKKKQQWKKDRKGGKEHEWVQNVKKEVIEWPEDPIDLEQEEMEKEEEEEEDTDGECVKDPKDSKDPKDPKDPDGSAGGDGKGLPSVEGLETPLAPGQWVL